MKEIQVEAAKVNNNVVDKIIYKLEKYQKVIIIIITLSILLYIVTKFVKKQLKKKELENFKNKVETKFLSFEAKIYDDAARQLKKLLDPPYLFNFNAGYVGDVISAVCKNKDDLFYLITLYGIDDDGYTLYVAIKKKFEKNEIEKKIIAKIQSSVVSNELNRLLQL